MAKTKGPLTEAELLKMPEKDYMNAAQLAFFKARLEAMRDEILEKAAETVEHMREIEAVALDIKATTAPEEPIYVFGFSPGVLVKSERRSASRFHWSRPVVIEFAAGTPGYGSAAVLADLEREAPSIVALQKQDWAHDDPALAGEPNSVDFFHGHAGLNAWLTSRYVRERETLLFEIWRRR